MVRVGIEQDIGGSAERIVVIDVETVDPTPLDPAFMLKTFFSTDGTWRPD